MNNSSTWPVLLNGPERPEKDRKSLTLYNRSHQMLVTCKEPVMSMVFYERRWVVILKTLAVDSKFVFAAAYSGDHRFAVCTLAEAVLVTCQISGLEEYTLALRSRNSLQVHLHQGNGYPPFPEYWHSVLTESIFELPQGKFIPKKITMSQKVLDVDLMPLSPQSDSDNDVEKSQMSTVSDAECCIAWDRIYYINEDHDIVVYSFNAFFGVPAGWLSSLDEDQCRLVWTKDPQETSNNVK